MEDIVRVLQNRYSNRESIAMEIIEDLERFPPLRPNQPRRVIDLIRAVEKALRDLAELESVEAIIESKLQEDMMKDWIRLTRKISNRQAH